MSVSSNFLKSLHHDRHRLNLYNQTMMTVEGKYLFPREAGHWISFGHAVDYHVLTRLPLIDLIRSEQEVWRI